MQDLLPKTFEPKAAEARILRMWEEGGYFGASARQVQEGGDPYVIVIPPPNVTAVLHMGHGLNNTIQDVLIRWRRMQGRVALWIPGTDHAGIATQNVVERQLAKEGKSRHELGRDEFVARVWEHVDETGDRILAQLKAIGCSCDWSRSRFTLDERLSKAVREVFIRLYEDDLIYRGEYIINWCPRCLTALSNEEAEGVETEGSLWHLRYPLAPGHEAQAAHAATAAESQGKATVGQFADGHWYLTVSTTRPETMLGDTGVAVAPADPRYSALVGATVELPLTGRQIPVVADDYVDADFGSGVVKVTPAHDSNDFEIAGRTGLSTLNIMDEHAVLNDEVPAAFRGMDRFAARKAVLSALEEEGFLAGRDVHSHVTPCCYRCETVVEPRLSEQWFVRMGPLAEPALAASRTGQLKFVPDRWTKVYEQWMEGIRDWCISRQLWWGHRIPVWNCADCEAVMVLREDPGRCGECGGRSLTQDPDVLDTWFSSWLWPFSVFGWPDDSEDLAAFYPGHTLSTAPEILFFWVARMVMSGCRMMGEPPFERVYLHGTVRDIQGRKMSKSLGNGIDPLEVANLYGADALRYTLIASAGVGADIRLDHEDIETAFSPGRNFVNKLWNAGRFTLMSLGDAPVLPLAEVRDELRLEDRWILSRLQRVAGRADSELERFRIHGAAEQLREFFWGEFADWYLEWIKPRLSGEAPGQQAARSVLAHLLDAICRLLHPLVPFVTEELWSRLPHSGNREGPVIVASWPKPVEELVDEASEAHFDLLRDLIVKVRALRKEYRVNESEEVTVWVSGPVPQRLLEENGQAFRKLARIGKVAMLTPDAETRGSAGASAVLRDGVKLMMPLEGVIDLERERKRLAKELERVRAQLKQTETKLTNSNFVERAPANVVQREHEKAESQRRQLEALREKRASLR